MVARAGLSSILLIAALGVAAQHRVVNFESAHVHPLERTPDGSTLLAVNTADARLEVFAFDANAQPIASRSIAVGLDPVSVRARNDNDIWVVNQLSDTISVIDLASGRVRATLATGDKPADVIFAGTPERAYVSVAGRNQLRIYDPANLAAAATILNLEGEEPRALARSADGSRVYVAFFESGNGSSIVGINQVSNPNGPYAGQNPPPNSGNTFSPALNPANPPAPTAAQIIRVDDQGVWRDDNGRDWSTLAPGRLHDHDVAIVDTATQGITYADRLMTTVMALGVAPDGRVSAIGTEATNEIRFEPNLSARFIRVRLGRFDPTTPTSKSIADLNPHLDYGQTTTTPELRAQSLGDPRGIVFAADGSAWISGMGSNHVIRAATDGTRQARVNVGQGPTGLVLSANGSKLYVLNKFDGSISTIDTATNTETSRLAYFDPTPPAIKQGRPLLYDTQASSGLGQIACASCHLDAKSDFLAWDLGDPSGSMKAFNQTCRPNQVCDNWHPMKGPMVTQVLSGIVGNGAMHWRGDRESVAAFAPAYVSLQGRASAPGAADMAKLEAFLANVAYAPNPNRNADGAMPTTVNVTGGTGNPANGQTVFTNQPTLGPTPCISCHSLPTGTSNQIDNPPGLPLAPQPVKTAQLRGLNEKTGWNRASNNNRKGFGFNSDSEFDTLFALLGAGFNFGPNNPQQLRRDVEAFLLVFDTGTHGAVGQQILFNGSNNADVTLTTRLDSFVSLANAGSIGLIAKARVGGESRGYVYATQGVLLGDREHAPTTIDALRAAAANGSEVVFTVVPAFTQYRAGVDRDGDGWFDADETDHGANPANASSQPTTFCRADYDGNDVLDSSDADAFHAAHAAGHPRANWNWSLGANGLPSIDATDLAAYELAYAEGCGQTVFGNGFE
ncbi:MAG: beta-propeller fold lactonase family protein [Rhodanobacteraceae bacterium]|nr:beta-propeller fold lactonase family protein [Rhodanobacteraceae bacterium]